MRGMRGVISWNGSRSDQFGIGIEKYPVYTKPKRKIETYEIPGRNGDIVIAQDAWENVEQEYEIFAGDGVRASVPGYFQSIAEWLCAPKGYCELWDDFDPMHFRMAYFEGPFDIDSVGAGNVGRAKITFNCKPQRYLIEGKTGVEITAATTIYNYTMYASRPLVFVERSAAGNGTVSVNGTVFTITGIPASGLYIDCEEMNCYDTNGTNQNSIVASSTSEFATLRPGENNIGLTGNVSKVTITPRWFEI